MPVQSAAGGADDEPEEDENKEPIRALDEGDIALLKTYGVGPYNKSIEAAQKDIKDLNKKIQELVGVKELDTGLAPPSQWDLVSDKQMMQEEQPLQVARCTKIIAPNTDDAKYVINVKQIAKFVVALGDRVAPADIEEGMRVGVDRNKYQIQIPLPPKIDPSVTMMTVEEKPDITYNDIGGNKDEIQKLREVRARARAAAARGTRAPPCPRAPAARRPHPPPPPLDPYLRCSSCRCSTPSASSSSASTRRRACCSTGRRAPARRWRRARSPTAPTRRSSA